jgi:hypothetical protein
MALKATTIAEGKWDPSAALVSPGGWCCHCIIILDV